MNTLLALVALASLATAGALLVYVARLRRDDSERSRARVAALSAAAAAGDALGVADAETGSLASGGTIETPPAPVDAGTSRRPVENAFTTGSVFADRISEGAGAGELRRFAAAAVAVAGIAAVALALTAGGSGSEAGEAAPARQHVASVPLELTLLVHERRDSSLVVRGTVSVPAALEGDRIEARIQVLDGTGRELSRVRAATSPAGLDAPQSGKGTHSFSASIPEAAGVGRYRIRFYRGERVLPHVDRRASGDPLSARR